MSALVAGVLFGVGLALSGMINPAKVLNFLDLTGSWDPSLGLVMAGALAVTTPAFAVARRRERPVLESEFKVPTRSVIDRPLVVGAVLFGVGWGLVGVCPGPALSALGLGFSETFPSFVLFVVAMIVGNLIGRVASPST